MAAHINSDLVFGMPCIFSINLFLGSFLRPQGSCLHPPPAVQGAPWATGTAIPSRACRLGWLEFGGVVRGYPLILLVPLCHEGDLVSCGRRTLPCLCAGNPCGGSFLAAESRQQNGGGERGWEEQCAAQACFGSLPVGPSGVIQPPLSIAPSGA